MAILSRTRLAAGAAVVAGLCLTSLGPPLPSRVFAQAGGFIVLAADLHVHGFPDGIAPWDAAREARRRRLDVIALTSHNSRRGWWMWTHAPRWLSREDVLVLPGQELTAVGYHMALVGLSRVVDWRLGMREAAEAAHAQGAVAILAHPAGRALRRVLSDEGLRALDGVEVAHPGMERDGEARRDTLAVYRRAAALHPGIAPIGSSDFHYVAPIGQCRTYVFVHQATAAGVIDALRSGRTVACDGQGDVYGTAELTRLVAERCRADTSLPPVGDSPYRRAGTFLVWAGLLGLVLAGTAGT